MGGAGLGYLSVVSIYSSAWIVVADIVGAKFRWNDALKGAQARISSLRSQLSQAISKHEKQQLTHRKEMDELRRSHCKAIDTLKARHDGEVKRLCRAIDRLENNVSALLCMA